MTVDIKSLWGVLIRVFLSLLCASVFYLVWMGTFILSADWGSPAIEVIGWLSAPVVTATGFATGIALFGHLAKTGKTRFLRILIYPLIGCAIGAGVVYWFGPMLIVFGMFMAGTASVALREAVLIIKKDRE